MHFTGSINSGAAYRNKQLYFALVCDAKRYSECVFICFYCCYFQFSVRFFLLIYFHLLNVSLSLIMWSWSCIQKFRWVMQTIGRVWNESHKRRHQKHHVHVLAFESNGRASNHSWNLNWSTHLPLKSMIMTNIRFWLSMVFFGFVSAVDILRSEVGTYLSHNCLSRPYERFVIFQIFAFVVYNFRHRRTLF